MFAMQGQQPEVRKMMASRSEFDIFDRNPDPALDELTELAAVLGGVSPLGGFGKVSGVILSLLILQLLSTASILLGLSQFITLAMWGAILLLASGGIVFKEWLGNRLLNARAAKHPSRVDPDHQGLKPGTT